MKRGREGWRERRSETTVVRYTMIWSLVLSLSLSLYSSVSLSLSLFLRPSLLLHQKVFISMVHTHRPGVRECWHCGPRMEEVGEMGEGGGGE